MANVGADVIVAEPVADSDASIARQENETRAHGS